MPRMRTLLTALVMVSALAGSAWAQGKGGLPVGPDPDAKGRAESAKERAANEKTYDETMKRLRSQPDPPKADPWARMRPADK
jgi:hypothetical protein